MALYHDCPVSYSVLIWRRYRINWHCSLAVEKPVHFILPDYLASWLEARELSVKVTCFYWRFVCFSFFFFTADPKDTIWERFGSLLVLDVKTSSFVYPEVCHFAKWRFTSTCLFSTLQCPAFHLCAVWQIILSLEKRSLSSIQTSLRKEKICFLCSATRDQALWQMCANVPGFWFLLGLFFTNYFSGNI